MSVVINETNFPDEEFRTYVAREFDLDGDGVLSDAEIAKVTKLTFNRSFQSLVHIKSVEVFTSLEELTLFWGCHFAELDFSKFPNLTELSQDAGYAIPPNYSSSGYHRTLDFRQNPKLVSISISTLIPSSTDLSTAIPIDNIYFPSSLCRCDLDGLYAPSNFVLDFSACLEIESVKINSMYTPKTSIRGLTNKAYFRYFMLCYWPSSSSQLDFLDLSDNARLTWVTIYVSGSAQSNGGQIRNNERLETLDLEDGTGGNWQIVNNQNIQTLCLSGCQLAGTLDVSSMGKLRWLDVSNTRIAELILGQQPNLKYLFIGTDAEKHAIASIDVTGCQILASALSGGFRSPEVTGRPVKYRRPTGGYYTSYRPSKEYVWTQISQLPSNYANIASSSLVGWAISLDPTRTQIIYFPPPVIQSPLVDQIVKTGAQVTFDANAKVPSQPTTWVWEYTREYSEQADSSPVWHTVSAQTVYSFTALKSDSGTYYRLTVSNAAGTAISTPAKLTVLDPVKIIEHPSLPEYVAVGSTATLSVTATGDELSYQWNVSTDGKTYFAIAEARSSNYTVQATDENNSKYYKCYVWNPVSNGYMYASDSVQLHVAYQPNITRPPLSQTIKTGDSANLSVEVTGGGLSYQWQLSTDGTTWADIENAAADEYSFAAVRSQSGYRYRCIVTNPAGTATSAAAIITVIDPPVITSQPTLPDDVPEGTRKTLSVRATGDNLFYQWQVSNNGSTYLNISGADAQDYSITASKEVSGKYYKCLVWNAVGNVTSSSVQLHVVFQPEITQHPVPGTVQSGVSVMLSVKATGESLKYQWQARANSSSDWQDLTDITAASYSFTPVRADSGMQYRCVITNAAGTAISDTATLTVLDPPIIITQPSLPADVIGDSQYTLTVEVTGDDLSYQWQVSSNGSLFEEIDGAWSATYSITATTANSGNQYRCFISNAVGSVLSSAATVHVVYQPEILQQPLSSTVETGKAVTLSTEASGDSLNHQWQYSSNNGANWINIATGTNRSYSFTAERSQSGYKYRCLVSNIVGSVITDVVTITVMDPPVITSQPSLPEIVSDGSVNQLSVTATGDSRSYQWQESSNGYTYVNIADAVRATYALTVSRENAGHQYRCIVSSAVGEVVTTPVTVNLLFQPEITATDFPDSIVQNGDAVRLAITAIGGSLTYQWQVSVDNEESWSNLIDGTGKSEYAFAASISQSGYAYRCVVTNRMGTATSETAVLNVLSPPAVISDPVSVIVGEGNLVTFRVSANGSNVSYQWQASSDYGSTWADLPNENSYQYAFVAERGQSDRQYRCRVYNDLASVFSAAAVLTVLTTPEVLTSPKSLTISYAKTAVFQVIATGGSLKYQWQSRPNDATDWTNITSGGTSDTYSFVALDTENGYQYRCFVLNDAGSVYSDAATLTVTEYEDPEQSEDISVRDGEYLPAQMAEAICALITYPEEITDLDDVYFGNMPNDSVYDYIDRSGFTDPRFYEGIAEALNEIKDYLKTIEGSEEEAPVPSGGGDTPVPSGGGGEIPTPVLIDIDVDSDIDSSVDLLGKSVSELQSGIQVADETISGASLYVYDYPDFSTDESLQSGNFLALHLEGSSTCMVIPRIYSSSDYQWHEISHKQVGDYLIMRLGSMTLTTLELTAYKDASAVWSSAFNVSGIARQRAY